MSNGPLTQSSNAVSTAAENIAAIKNLPPAALPVQATAASFNTTVLPQIHDTQALVQNLAPVAETKLTAAQSILSANPGQLSTAQIAQIKAYVISAQSDAHTLASNVDATNTAIVTYYGQITDGSKQLHSLLSDLQGQRVNLQSRVDSANSEVASIKSKMKYYALLGLLGLPGLAVMTGLLVSAQKNASEISGQIGPLEQQLASVNTSIISVNQLTNSFTGLSSNILSMRNSINFVASDIDEIMNDLNASNSAAALIFINTAIVELRTLISDAS